MDLQLAKHERMLLALLRAALAQKPAEVAVFSDCSLEQWAACYKLAVAQGVMAIAWDGATTLPSEMRPPKAIRLKWMVAVDDYEKRYRYYCKTIQTLSAFYTAHGITTMQMKGVGFSSYYPVPSHREGGDIDIYTFSADQSVMSDKEANSLADQLMEQQNIKVDFEHAKHSVFYYHNVPIENHKSFLDIEELKIAVPVEAELKKVMSPKDIALLDGECTIKIPSSAFNTLFISFHAMQHYGTGMTLHHLCDWACLLNRQGLQVPQSITNPYYLSMISTLTAFTNKYLGTDVQTDSTDEAVDRMMYEILHSPYLEVPVTRNLFTIFCHKAYRFMHLAKLRKEIMGEVVWRTVWSSILLHLRKPEIFFKL